MSLKEQVKAAKAKRNKLIADQRALTAKAETEKREIDSEELSRLDAMQKDIDGLDGRVQTLESALSNEPDEDDEDRDDDEKKDTNTQNDERSNKTPVGTVKILPDGTRAVVIDPSKQETRRNTDTGKLEKREYETPEQFARRERRAGDAYQKAFRSFILRGAKGVDFRRAEEARTLVAGVDVDGGYLIAPEDFRNQVLKKADNALWIRQLATKFTVSNGASLGVPSLDTDPDDADWTSELATGNLDSAMKIGKRELRPNPLAKRELVSNKLIRHAQVSGVISVNDESQGGIGNGIVNFLTGRLGYKFAVSQEQGFLTGNGQGRPLGLFVASSRGISTGRDVTTNATAAINFDSLMETKYSLRAPYHATAKWLFHRAAIRRIRQLKDSFGQYLWQESVQAGQPDKILDNEVMMSEYVPSTFTTGSYVGIFGDFSYYWIADGDTLAIQVLAELYAEKNLTEYIARAEVDGMPALEEAFARVKLG